MYACVCARYVIFNLFYNYGNNYISLKYVQFKFADLSSKVFVS